MFSGIVKAKGRIRAQSARDGDRQIVVDAEPTLIEHLQLGGSIAVNGVCLTAVERTGESFTADVSQATLRVTTLGTLRVGSLVNLEPALKVGEPLDGHFVTGHVDGVGRVISLVPEARSLRLSIELPPALGRYVALKGSIAVDGVSLTVNGLGANRFEVNVIPHTQAATVVSEYALGTPVNIEVDLIARYLEKLKGHGYAGND